MPDGPAFAAGNPNSELESLARKFLSHPNPVDWTRVMELVRQLPPLQELEVSPAILEAAGAIADSSDVLGLELHTLEDLLRLVLFLDRLDSRGLS